MSIISLSEKIPKFLKGYASQICHPQARPWEVQVAVILKEGRQEEGDRRRGQRGT